MSSEARKKREGTDRGGERYKHLFGGDILHTAFVYDKQPCQLGNETEKGKEWEQQGKGCRG